MGICLFVADTPLEVMLMANLSICIVDWFFSLMYNLGAENATL